jgi:hypothetical protein
VTGEEILINWLKVLNNPLIARSVPEGSFVGGEGVSTDA